MPEPELGLPGFLGSLEARRRPFVLLVIVAAAALAVPTPAPADGGGSPAPRPPAADVVRELDALLAAAWTAAGVKPAGPADDAEWLRRVHLDLEGVIPEPSVVAGFLARDGGAERRVAHVRGLLHGQRFARAWAGRWANLLVGRRAAREGAARGDSFATWLTAQVAANVPWDQVVRQLLDPKERTGPGEYRARFPQVEELTGNALRVLQGVQLQCAQCHDHPYNDEWKQADFWATAALFTPDAREVRIPTMMMGQRGAVVAPRFVLTGEAAPAGARPAAVGKLLTAPGNPYFARAVVNRVWSWLFGRAFQDPDDLTQAPQLPAVLDRLVKDFVDSGHDLRRLVEVVVSTRAWQQSSSGPAASRRAQEAVFARAAVRTLTPEQLWASLIRAAGLDAPDAPAPARDRLPGLERDFFRVFAGDQDDAAGDHSITQALSLINGPLTNAALRGGAEGAPAFAEVLALPADEQVAALFLRVLGRPATRAERTALRGDGRSSEERLQLLQDVAWALLNSSEFSTNH